jgi:hypothetical protein
MRDLDRISRTTSDTSENRVGSFALGFFGLLCVMAVGFVSALRPPVQIQLTTATTSASELRPFLHPAKILRRIAPTMARPSWGRR